MIETKSPDLLGEIVQNCVRSISELEGNPVVKQIQERWTEALADIGNYIPVFDVDIVRTIDGVTVTVDVAGFQRNGISLNIEKNALLIEAVRKKDLVEGKVILSGRPTVLRKKVLLPFFFEEKDNSVGTADYKDGVLTVNIKKPKPKRAIAIG